MDVVHIALPCETRGGRRSKDVSKTMGGRLSGSFTRAPSMPSSKVPCQLEHVPVAFRRLPSVCMRIRGLLRQCGCSAGPQPASVHVARATAAGHTVISQQLPPASSVSCSGSGLLQLGAGRPSGGYMRRPSGEAGATGRVSGTFMRI